MIVMWEYEENSCQFISSSTFIGCEEKQFSGLLFEEAVAWWLKRESFSYSTLYFSNLNFPNIFPRKFTCPTGEWWTKSTNPTTNYISYSPGLSDMTFFASLFQDNFCEMIPVWFNKTTETSVGDVLLLRQITSVLELNHVALCLICDLCSVDLNTSAEQVVGMHDEAIKCVEYSPQSGRIFCWYL